MDNIVDRVLALRNIELFNGVSEHILMRLAERLTVKDIISGAQVIRKDDIGHEMFIIMSGTLHIKQGQDVLATLKKGDIVGELSILAPLRRTADVYAAEHSVLYVLQRDDFLELMYYHQSMNRNVIQVLVDRIIRLNERLRSDQATL